MSIWVIALLAGPAVLVPLAAYSLSHHRVKGARWYGVLLLAVAWWSLAYAWELTTDDVAVKALALKIKYVGVVALPPAWIAFILEFVGAAPARVRARAVPLTVVAVCALAVLATDEWHGWFWGPMTVQPVGQYVVLRGRAPGFWINVGYTYVVLGLGLALLLQHTVHSPYLYRRRAVILMAGAILPWAGNIVFVAHREEMIFDPTPFLFTCTALVAALAVFRYDLLEPAPTLRDARIGSVGDAVIILDGRRRVADLNAAAQAMLGLRRAEAAGRDIGDLLPGWPGAPPVAPIDVTMGSGDGPRIFDMRCSAIENLAGHATGSIVILRDVTERRAAEARLRESERRYRTVIEQAFDGVWLTDLDGVITDANPQAAALLGYPIEDLIGRRASEFFAGTAPGAEREEALRRGEAVSWEHEYLTKGGLAVLLAGRSRLLGSDLVVSTFRDITEERLQAQLRERLLDEAQAANRLKDEFLATVSHELRTPLNAVVGWTQMLVQRQVDESRLGYALSVIERNANAQVRLIEDLLDLSKLAAGRMRLTLRPTSPATVIRDAIEAVTPSAGAKRLSLQADLPGDLPDIPADPDRLRQAVWNLLTNAIKFTPSGGRIDLRARGGGELLVIEVADTGSGIAADFLPHVFEAFRQADSSLAGQSRGLGLGLTIVRRIVEAHGGRVEVESDGPGCGSTFRLTLPSRGRESHAATAGAGSIEPLPPETRVFAGSSADGAESDGSTARPDSRGQPDGEGSLG
jgi:PAS domain S-box-containing protein